MRYFWQTRREERNHSPLVLTALFGIATKLALRVGGKGGIRNMTPWHETTKWPFRPKARPEMNANKTAAEAESKVGQERTDEGDTRKGKESRRKGCEGHLLVRL